MARNIEIKARIESVQALVPRVMPWASDGPTYLVQDDTLLTCASGRLNILELEVVLGNDSTLSDGEQEAQAVMEKLGVQQSQLVEDAYVDLLAQRVAQTD